MARELRPIEEVGSCITATVYQVSYNTDLAGGRGTVKILGLFANEKVAVDFVRDYGSQFQFCVMGYCDPEESVWFGNGQTRYLGATITPIFVYRYCPIDPAAAATENVFRRIKMLEKELGGTPSTDR
jgi:hypothetical protein